MKLKMFDFQKRWKVFLLSLISCLIFYSCINKEDFDLDKIAGVEWTGSYALPILNSTLTLNDLLPQVDSNYVKSDEEGLIYFEYNEKILNYDIRDNFKIPSRSLNKQYLVPEIKLPSFSNAVDLSLEQLTGVNNTSTPFMPFLETTPSPNSFNFPSYSDIVYVIFENGTMNLKVANNAKATLLFNIELRNVGGPSIGTFAFTVAGNGGAETKQVSLSGVTITKQVQVVVTSISSPGSLDTFNPQDRIELSIGVSEDAKASEGEIILQEDVKISANEPIDFELYPEQLKEILLKTGSFNYFVESQIGYPAEATLSLPTMDKNAVFFANTFQVPSKSTANGNLSLADYKANLSTLSPAYNRFPIKIDLIFKKSASSFKWKNTDFVDVQIAMNNLDFKYLKGYFGKQPVTLSPHTFQIGIFENTLNGYDVSIRNPEITFNVANEYGVPVRMDLIELSAANNDKTLPISTNPDSPFDLGFPASFFEKASSTKLEIKNAQEIYKLNPSSITYQAEAMLNYNVSSGNNFLTDTSKVIVEMNAKIPLWGKAGNIVLKDTIENSLEGDIQEAKVEFVKIKTSISNQFPIDVRLQIYFADENYTIIDSLFTPAQTSFIKSSEVDVNGDLLKAGLLDQTIDVNKAKFEKMVKAPYLIIKGNLSTAESAQKDVKIKTSYKIEVKLGLQTKLDVKVRL